MHAPPPVQTADWIAPSAQAEASFSSLDGGSARVSAQLRTQRLLSQAAVDQHADATATLMSTHSMQAQRTDDVDAQVDSGGTATSNGAARTSFLATMGSFHPVTAQDIGAADKLPALATGRRVSGAALAGAGSISGVGTSRGSGSEGVLIGSGVLWGGGHESRGYWLAPEVLAAGEERKLAVQDIQEEIQTLRSGKCVLPLNMTLSAEVRAPYRQV